MSEDCSLEEEINARLIKGRVAITKMKDIWRNNNVSIRTKKRIVESVTWSTASYGCKSWMLKKKTTEKNGGF